LTTGIGYLDNKAVGESCQTKIRRGKAPYLQPLLRNPVVAPLAGQVALLVPAADGFALVVALFTTGQGELEFHFAAPEIEL